MEPGVLCCVEPKPQSLPNRLSRGLNLSSLARPRALVRSRPQSAKSPPDRSTDRTWLVYVLYYHPNCLVWGLAVCCCVQLACLYRGVYPIVIRCVWMVLDGSVGGATHNGSGRTVVEAVRRLVVANGSIFALHHRTTIIPIAQLQLLACVVLWCDV